MTNVAKLVIINNDGKYLLLYRDDHPRLGNDPDLLGGILENGEKPSEAMAREAQEEAGVKISPSKVEKVYESGDYSEDGTWSLYRTQLDHTPTITLSWEHASYEWLDRTTFMNKARNANDAYMHMVYDALK